MAVTVETGAGVSGANSYVSEAELTAYATSIGKTLTGTAETLLIRAAYYTETLEFIGNKLTKAQRMQWPRSNVKLDGFDVEEDEIPETLKLLQMEVAISIDEGVDPTADPERLPIRNKVGEIEEEYSDSGYLYQEMAPHILNLANKLIGVRTGGCNFTVTRG
jgi:hypothetical protein